MVSPGEETYWLARLVFQRGLAFIYLLAFLVAARQFRPLAGEDGLFPLHRVVQNRAFIERPSLFHLVPSDRVIGMVAWIGVGLSVGALLGGPYWLPEPYPVVASMLLWAVLWALYLSFVNVGQLFYGYGWESMLLETGFLAIFLGAGASAPPVIVIWLLKWVLFRNMFGAGLIKLRGDGCWRDLSCLENHYETQPMPNPGSWFAHHLPRSFHRLEVLGNHVVELAVPFLYFAPQPVAAAGGVVTIGFQLWLMLTGNFAWLNALTLVQAIVTVSDGTVRSLAGGGVPTPTTTPALLWWLSIGVGALVIVLSIRPVKNMLSSHQVMNTAFDPLHLVNTYGAFGSITSTRHQLIIEGTKTKTPGENDWEPYVTKGQPVAVDERPPQWAPYHLRLDWQLWFAAMVPRPGPRQQWIHQLVGDLLEGDPETHSLFAEVPFDAEDPPAAVRILRYRYRFTSPDERRETGNWWASERIGVYLGPTTDTTGSRIGHDMG